MTAAKRMICVSLDADLVAELEAGDEALAKEIDDAIRRTLERRRRRRRLSDLLTELDERHGRVSEALIAKYEALLE